MKLVRCALTVAAGLLVLPAAIPDAAIVRCAAQTPAPSGALEASPAEDGKSDYVLHASDEIEIKLPYHSDMNATMTIRPDGKIAFPLIGEIAAEGLTPAALSTEISKRLEVEVKNPQATVIVKKFAELRFYVGGEVTNSGVYPLTQPMTTLQAIMQAGGFKASAQPRNVMIVRAVNRTTPTVIKIALDEKSIGHLEALNNTLIRPLDMVFVPKSGIYRLDEFVEMYIKRLDPAALILGLNYNAGAFVFRQ